MKPPTSHSHSQALYLVSAHHVKHGELETENTAHIEGRIDFTEYQEINVECETM